MPSALSAQLAAEIGERIFEPLEVRPVGEGHAWRTVQGRVRAGATVEQFHGLAGQAVVGDDQVHLMAADFTDGFPAAKWWVRELSGANAGRVSRISEPARVKTGNALFIWAPIKPNSETVPT